MNKQLKDCFRLHSWSKLEGFLQYLRGKECFEGIGGQKDANPYWYGTVLDFNKAEKECRDLLANQDMSEDELKKILASAEKDLNSPIVTLTGIFLNRVLFGIKNESGA